MQRPTATYALVWLLGFLCCFFLIPGKLAAKTSGLTEPGVAKYLDEHESEIRRKLTAYNKRHRIASDTRVYSWDVIDLEWEVLNVTENRAWVEMDFWIGIRGWNLIQGKAAFELAWKDGQPRFVGHRIDRPSTAPEPVLPAPGQAAEPLRSAEVVEIYLREREPEVRDRLAAYNKEKRYVVPAGGEWGIRRFEWKVAGLEGKRVFLEIELVLKGYWADHGSGLFELAWVGDDLEFISHRDLPKRPPTASGWLSYGGDDCINNYYAPNPCLGVVRAWTEFSDFHGLPLGPESAKIYQAYKQNSYELGDRLMARARGLPDPTGESAFGIHAEVRAMNLTQYQRGSDRVGCDLNPYSPHPCPEILRVFRDFAERHDLPPDAATATMLEAYSQGNFEKADVIYALSKDLDVPAYGYLTTVAGKEVQELRRIIMRIQAQDGGAVGCSVHPYRQTGGTRRGGDKTCPKITRLWREFAKRYQLEDNAEMGRIFQQYANGEYRAGDQLLAQAKGVSLEQLLEAAGVPTSKGLVIEVFPGLKRSFQKGRTGV